MEIREQVKIVSPELVMEPLLELLEQTAQIPLVISGSSMTPFLAPGRDTVFLSRVEDPLKRGDMVLYQRNNGRYVLHRIYRLEDQTFTMLGDAQTEPEPGIRRDQIRAIVTAARRKGKLEKKGSFWWEFFRVLWIRMVPLRPLVRRGYLFVRKLFGQGKGQSK